MKKILKISLYFIIIVVLTALIINLYVVSTTKSSIYKYNQNQSKDADAILILGAAVRGNQPSPMLQDRLDEGIRLYKEGYADKIIMSGDHQNEYYSEVNIMKDYAINQGVPSDHIIIDDKGYSTYESVYRAKNIFQINHVIIVTQEYHLYRALYIAKSLDMEVYGANSNPRTYSNQYKRDVREIAARIKDFFACLIEVKPQYLSE